MARSYEQPLMSSEAVYWTTEAEHEPQASTKPATFAVVAMVVGAVCYGYGYASSLVAEGVSLYAAPTARVSVGLQHPVPTASHMMRGRQAEVPLTSVHSAPASFEAEAPVGSSGTRNVFTAPIATLKDSVSAVYQRATGLGVLMTAMGALLMSYSTGWARSVLGKSARAPASDASQAMYTTMAMPQSGRYKLSHNIFEEILAFIKAILFLVANFAVAIPLFFFGMLPFYGYCKMFDPHVRRSLDRINWLWATLSSFLFYKVEVVNPENLPAEGVAAMYVANHQSWLDIFAMYSLNKGFKWVSKSSIFYIPITGWAMGLTGHVSLKRMDNKSQMKVLKDCMAKLKNGVSMFFFPEGTRSKTGELGEFKKGAFTIAKKLKVPIIPITVSGTGNMMPPGSEFRLYNHKPGIKLIVHPAIYPDGELTDVQLMAMAREAIASCVPADCQGSQ